MIKNDTKSASYDTKNDKIQELEKIKERKRISDKKYYDKIKQEKLNSDHIINKIECAVIPSKEIEVIKNIDWLEWLWTTTIGGLQMMGQTIIQATMTMSIPLIIMYLKPNTTTPLITTSQQVLKQEEKSIQPQITSLSSL